MTIKINVVAHTVNPNTVKKVFHEILSDYCNRFGVSVVDEQINISVVFMVVGDEDPMNGLITFKMNDKGEQQGHDYIVQVRDPWLSDWELNPYTQQQFLDTLSHEFVHVCQCVTGRKGFKLKGLNIDKENDKERYFFDPIEMEARLLEGFYSDRYTHKVL